MRLIRAMVAMLAILAATPAAMAASAAEQHVAVQLVRGMGGGGFHGGGFHGGGFRGGFRGGHPIQGGWHYHRRPYLLPYADECPYPPFYDPDCAFPQG